MLLKPRLSTVSNVDWTNVQVVAFKATASTARHHQSQSQSDTDIEALSACIRSSALLITDCCIKRRCQAGMLEYSFPGTFVPMMELSFSGPFVPWNFRSQDYSFSGTFVPWTVRSLELSFLRRINTADISLLGPFVSWTVHSLKLSFQVPGPFLPWTIRSFVGTTQKAIGKLNKATESFRQL